LRHNRIKLVDWAGLEQWRLADFLKLRPSNLRDGKQKTERRWTRTDDASFGCWLKRHREQGGITVADIAARTRIPNRMLLAIERDDFNSLPGGIYTRNFLRQYATAVGLPCADAMEAFDSYANESPASIGAPGPLAIITTMEAVPDTRLRARTLGLAVAGSVFRVLEAVLPRRVTHEEFGDATEYLNAPDRRTWEIWLKTTSTIFWVVVHSVLFIAAMVAAWSKQGTE
jgi:transcriptional regulator with XRE-family HTH domain